MSRVIIRGQCLEEMTVRELRSVHDEITLFASDQDVGPQEYQAFWGDDLEEIGREIAGRERPN